jgi:hypothetical protein
MAANESPATHQDQAISDALPSPWRLRRPRRTLVPLRVQWISQTCGYRFPGANPWLAHVAGDPLYCSGDGERPPIQARGSLSRPLAGLVAAVIIHAKQRVTSKGLRSFKIWKQYGTCGSTWGATNACRQGNRMNRHGDNRRSPRFFSAMRNP